MTHVWQYSHGAFVVLDSLWSQARGNAYETVPGSAWETYNVEQQATIVERWYVGGMSKASPYYRYVNDTIRKQVLSD